jgi:hypothetical protein
VKDALLRNRKPIYRFNFGLEKFNVSLEGEFSLIRHLGICCCPHILSQNRPE